MVCTAQEGAIVFFFPSAMSIVGVCQLSTDNIGDSLQIYVENKKEQSNIAILNAYRITNR